MWNFNVKFQIIHRFLSLTIFINYSSILSSILFEDFNVFALHSPYLCKCSMSRGSFDVFFVTYTLSVFSGAMFFEVKQKMEIMFVSALSTLLLLFSSILNLHDPIWRFLFYLIFLKLITLESKNSD